MKPPWEPHSLQRLSTLGGSEKYQSKPKLKAKERIAKESMVVHLGHYCHKCRKKRKWKKGRRGWTWWGWCIEVWERIIIVIIMCGPLMMGNPRIFIMYMNAWVGQQPWCNEQNLSQCRKMINHTFTPRSQEALHAQNACVGAHLSLLLTTSTCKLFLQHALPPWLSS